MSKNKHSKKNPQKTNSGNTSNNNLIGNVGNKKGNDTVKEHKAGAVIKTDIPKKWTAGRVVASIMALVVLITVLLGAVGNLFFASGNNTQNQIPPEIQQQLLRQNQLKNQSTNPTESPATNQTANQSDSSQISQNSNPSFSTSSDLKSNPSSDQISSQATSQSISQTTSSVSPTNPTERQTSLINSDNSLPASSVNSSLKPITSQAQSGSIGQ